MRGHVKWARKGHKIFFEVKQHSLSKPTKCLHSMDSFWGSRKMLINMSLLSLKCTSAECQMQGSR